MVLFMHVKEAHMFTLTPMHRTFARTHMSVVRTSVIRTHTRAHTHIYTRVLSI